MNNQNDTIKFTSRDGRETVSFFNEEEMKTFLKIEEMKDIESANAFKAAFNRGEYPSNRDMLEHMSEEKKNKIIDWHKSQPFNMYVDWEKWLDSTEMSTVNFIRNNGRFTRNDDGEEKHYFIFDNLPEYAEGLDYVSAYCLEDQTVVNVPDPQYDIEEG